MGGQLVDWWGCMYLYALSSIMVGKGRQWLLLVLDAGENFVWFLNGMEDRVVWLLVRCC
jgi:hypothetical protein